MPKELSMSNSILRPLPPGALPSVEDATLLYERLGSHLENPVNFGQDPLEEFESLQLMREKIQKQIPEFDPMFNRVVNGDAHPLFLAIVSFMRLSLMGCTLWPTPSSGRYLA